MNEIFVLHDVIKTILLQSATESGEIFLVKSNIMRGDTISGNEEIKGNMGDVE